MGKEITIYDIATKLNLSAATVSRGLKGHPSISASTRKRIVDTARELGYRFNSFASNLRLQRTNTIGIIVPRLNSNFMSDAIAGMEKVANKAGYKIIISQSLESTIKETENISTLFNARVDGLLVSLASDTSSISEFEQFINRNIPVVFFDRVFNHPKCPNIVIDNYRAGYEAADHLFQKGCRRIMHIGGNQTGKVYRERFEGYQKALRDHGLIASEDLLIISQLSFEEGTSAAVQILAMNEKPDGVFVANDACAIGCMLELKKHGVKIPEEIAFVGFNNDPMALVIEPNLTTIDYPGEEMGELGATLLLSLLNNNNDDNFEQTLLLPHKLMDRQSSQKAASLEIK
ncbi:LacI family DNA-binding transcriptional regulator [Desertivirga arenae]|uniref:LacI family DNA-binding transcriptional regulator n=1 Tax=Desertivirga arenae TaxID=2810309 RepID=UPI001A96B155|nr:LacI family DNA-binding transcriptional regulator [Pedobacter sp. SYSU D00823]